MEVDEIFAEICTRSIEGIMFHDQMSKLFDFLGIDALRIKHEMHFMLEYATYRNTNRYFTTHYNMLIPEKEIEPISVIPSSWYRHERKDVDANTRRNAVKDAISKWVDWEKGTKEVYEKAFKALYESGYVAASIAVEKLVEDVDNELAVAEQKKLEMEITDWNLDSIIDI